MTINVNLEVDVNETKTYNFTWTDSLTNLPRDTSNFSARMEIRDAPRTGALLKSYGSDFGTLYVGSLGQVKILFTPGDLISLPTGNYWYDLYLSKRDGSMVVKLVKGFLTVTNFVTQAPPGFLAGTILCATTLIATLA